MELDKTYTIKVKLKASLEEIVERKDGKFYKFYSADAGFIYIKIEDVYEYTLD